MLKGARANARIWFGWSTFALKERNTVLVFFHGGKTLPFRRKNDPLRLFCLLAITKGEIIIFTTYSTTFFTVPGCFCVIISSRKKTGALLPQSSFKVIVNRTLQGLFLTSSSACVWMLSIFFKSKTTFGHLPVTIDLDLFKTCHNNNKKKGVCLFCLQLQQSADNCTNNVIKCEIS